MNTNIPISTTSGAAVFRQVRETLDEPTPEIDRRVRVRHPWRATLTAWVMDEPEGDRGVREIQVETIDISTTGFGFSFRQFIHVGAMLRTRLDVLPGKPIVDGIIAHCRLADDSRHIFGVQFVKGV